MAMQHPPFLCCGEGAKCRSWITDKSVTPRDVNSSAHYVAYLFLQGQRAIKDHLWKSVPLVTAQESVSNGFYSAIVRPGHP
jgi:hypothetical protein